jgi:hypothetical protein
MSCNTTLDTPTWYTLVSLRCVIPSKAHRWSIKVPISCKPAHCALSPAVSSAFQTLEKFLTRVVTPWELSTELSTYSLLYSGSQYSMGNSPTPCVTHTPTWYEQYRDILEMLYIRNWRGFAWNKLLKSTHLHSYLMTLPPYYSYSHREDRGFKPSASKSETPGTTTCSQYGGHLLSLCDTLR